MPNLAQKILSCSATESAESRSFSFLYSTPRAFSSIPSCSMYFWRFWHPRHVSMCFRPATREALPTLVASLHFRGRAIVGGAAFADERSSLGARSRTNARVEAAARSPAPPRAVAARGLRVVELRRVLRVREAPAGRASTSAPGDKRVDRATRRGWGAPRWGAAAAVPRAAGRGRARLRVVDVRRRHGLHATTGARGKAPPVHAQTSGFCPTLP